MKVLSVEFKDKGTFKLGDLCFGFLITPPPAGEYLTHMKPNFTIPLVVGVIDELTPYPSITYNVTLRGKFINFPLEGAASVDWKNGNYTNKVIGQHLTKIPTLDDDREILGYIRSILAMNFGIIFKD